MIVELIKIIFVLDQKMNINTNLSIILVESKHYSSPRNPG